MSKKKKAKHNKNPTRREIIKKDSTFVSIKDVIEASFRYTTNIIMIVFISAVGKVIYNCEGFSFYTVLTFFLVFLLLVTNVFWYIRCYVFKLPDRTFKERTYSFIFASYSLLMVVLYAVLSSTHGEIIYQKMSTVCS